MTYRIVRFFQDKESPRHRQIRHRGLTLDEAREHCADPETSSSTCKSSQNKLRTKLNGPWFDGFEPNVQ